MYLASFYDECRYFAITIFLNSPLIGVSFCKQYFKEGLTMLNNKVSVPLSGLASVNELDAIKLKEDILFPSPYRG